MGNLTAGFIQKKLTSGQQATEELGYALDAQAQALRLQHAMAPRPRYP
jgi:hypothetical protein